MGTIAVLLAVGASVAYAATVICDGGRCVGTDEADMIFGAGAGAPDSIFAKAGADDVNAGQGRDFVNAGPGADDVDLAANDDEGQGRRGDDLIDGGTGDDVLRGGDSSVGLSTAGSQFAERLTDRQGNLGSGPADSDSVSGGAGDEEIDVEDSDGQDEVKCGPGNELVASDRGDRVEADCGIVIR
jgi:Ca2+-binding RTX toxin-like protein